MAVTSEQRNDSSNPTKPGLLFQSVLSQWFQLHDHLKEVDASLSQHTEANSKRLHAALLQLIGSQPGDGSNVIWTQSRAALTELHQRTMHFATLRVTGSVSLRDSVARGLRAFLQAQDRQRRARTPADNAQLKIILCRGTSQMRIAGELMARMIVQFRDDENILFFVLRHSARFDSHFGKGFVYAFFADLFPGGFTEAIRFLRDRYQQRGFGHLNVAIAAKAEILFKP